MIVRMSLIACLLLNVSIVVSADRIDSDGDGLSDFQEIHKYCTSPQQSDSDGDGTPDEDWHERREYAYTVRTVTKVMRPCHTAFISDDYQDARVLAETDDYVELEVIHYPLNTVAQAIKGVQPWREAAAVWQEYVEPGITTNWDESMQAALLSELQGQGIGLEVLTDKEVVSQVAAWLLRRSRHRAMFGTQFMHFPDGRATVYPGLNEAFRRQPGNAEMPFEEQLQHEVYGKGMFDNKCHGHCSSTAIYLATGLRAVGIPTRMVLGIPVVDASDPAQIQMIEQRIQHHEVRHMLLTALRKLGEGYACHVLNEVYVGGRWVRLDGKNLAPNTYGPGVQGGLLTRVHTFHDLSDANLALTWGARYALGLRDDTFRHSNPYRTTEVSDHFGVHADIPNPPVQRPTPDSIMPKIVVITQAYWFFSEERPQWMRGDAVEPSPDGHLFFRVDVPLDVLRTIYPKLDRRFTLLAEGFPPVHAKAERGCWRSDCYVRIPEAELARMVKGVPYQIRPMNSKPDCQWEVDSGVTVTRDE